MTAEQLKAAGLTLYGEGWRPLLAQKLSVDIATLRRWTSGVTPVPGPVSVAVELMLRARHERGTE